jgi:L1 cell adhesion molecule like protein
MIPVEQVLRDANVAKADVTDIVLVGGSSRIPRIRQMLQDFFNGKQPYRGIDPDEAVAIGATIQAAIMKNVDPDLTNNALLLDVALTSLGIEAGNERMNVFIPRNSIIPTHKRQIIST